MSELINTILNSFFELLQNNEDILNKVNAIHPCTTPINPSTPYIRLYISNVKESERYFKNNNNSTLKANLVCNIFTFDESDLYSLVEIINDLFQKNNLNTKAIEDFKIIQNYCSVSQIKNNNVLLASLNFVILTRIKK